MMRSRLAVLIPAALLATAAPATAEEEPLLGGPRVQGRAPVASLTVVGGEAPHWEQLLVYPLNDAPPGAPGSRVLLRRETYPDRATRAVSWTSSDDCPQARAIVRSLMTVPPAPPPQYVTLDGVDVHIVRRTGSGVERSTAEYGEDNPSTRLALWAAKALRPCWRRDLASVAF